ncbi:MAG TPA: hypothetical protein VMD29_04980 [Terracidiphilus sp.]|nr:hypothetical protein [Terracidiphilus sp.]HUA22062.1 hypothetical protein [Bryobacteraceae bacterium]
MPQIIGLCIAWLVLAAVAVSAVTFRRASKTAGLGPAKDSGPALVVVAALYSLALVVGFFFVTQFLVSSL